MGWECGYSNSPHSSFTAFQWDLTRPRVYPTVQLPAAGRWAVTVQPAHSGNMEVKGELAPRGLDQRGPVRPPGRPETLLAARTEKKH